MGRVDVSELLHDPDFVDKMSVISRVPTVNSKGQNSLKECAVDSVGSVQPASGKAIFRLPEELRVSNVMSFWFQGVITASAPGKYSSIIVFRGLRFQVQTVFDWTAFGAGWCEGTCVAEVPA